LLAASIYRGLFFFLHPVRLCWNLTYADLLWEKNIVRWLKNSSSEPYLTVLPPPFMIHLKKLPCHWQSAWYKTAKMDGTQCTALEVGDKLLE
jgi:hypothetical protein